MNSVILNDEVDEAFALATEYLGKYKALRHEANSSTIMQAEEVEPLLHDAYKTWAKQLEEFVWLKQRRSYFQPN